MRKIFRSVLVFGVVLATAMVCGAEPLDANHAIVASQGVTGVTAAFGKTEVVVKIATHEVDIGRPSYKLEITFDENLVRERTLISNEARQIMQKTTYFALQSMNK